MLTTAIDVGENNPSNQLENLLEFSRLANQPTNGLFLKFQEKLIKEPDLIGELSSFTQPMIPHAIAGFTREILIGTQHEEIQFGKSFWVKLGSRSLESPISSEWMSLFIAMRTAIENITGPAADEFSNSAFLRNLPLYINTYVLTKWLDHMAYQNVSRLKKLSPHGFSSQVWKIPITNTEFQLNLIDQDNDGNWSLSPAVKKDLEGLGLEKFTEQLSEIVQRDGFGDYFYYFQGDTDTFTLYDALVRAMTECHNVRPFSDPSSFLRALAFGLTRQEGSFGFTLADLESSNLLDSVHRILVNVSLDTLRIFMRILFEDLKIGKLGNGERNLITSFYADSPLLLNKVRGLLDSIQMIYEWDRPVKDLPSPFESYYTLLSFISPAEISSVSSILDFLAKGKFISLLPDSKERKFPAIYQFLKNGKSLAELLSGLSQLAPVDRRVLLRPIYKIVENHTDGESGIERHFELLNQLQKQYPQGLKFWLTVVLEKGGELVPTEQDIVQSERQWAMRFVKGNDFRELWNYFNAHGNRKQVYALITKLQRLQKQGYLAEAFQMLSNFQNDRIKRMCSILLKWDRSGELSSFLSLAEKFVGP